MSLNNRVTCLETPSLGEKLGFEKFKAINREFKLQSMEIFIFPFLLKISVVFIHLPSKLFSNKIMTKMKELENFLSFFFVSFFFVIHFHVINFNIIQ